MNEERAARPTDLAWAVASSPSPEVPSRTHQSPARSSERDCDREPSKASIESWPKSRARPAIESVSRNRIQAHRCQNQPEKPARKISAQAPQLLRLGSKKNRKRSRLPLSPAEESAPASGGVDQQLPLDRAIDRMAACSIHPIRRSIDWRAPLRLGPQAMARSLSQRTRRSSSNMGAPLLPQALRRALPPTHLLPPLRRPCLQTRRQRPWNWASIDGHLACRPLV